MFENYFVLRDVMGSVSIWWMGVHLVFEFIEKKDSTPLLGHKKYSFVSGAPGDENKSHAGGRKNIFFGKSVKKNTVENSIFYFSGLQ